MNLLAVPLAGCGDDAETFKEDVEAKAGEVQGGIEGVVEEVKQQAGYFLTILESHLPHRLPHSTNLGIVSRP